MDKNEDSKGFPSLDSKSEVTGIGDSNTRNHQTKHSAVPLSYERPLIPVNNRHLRDIADDSIDALVKANSKLNLLLFIRGGKLVELTQDRKGKTHCSVVSEVALRGILDRVADYMSVTKKEDDCVYKPARPPRDLAPDLLARAHTLPFPSLEMISYNPIYTRDGVLLAVNGYHLESGIYVDLGALILPPFPAPADGLQQLLELMCDFPFANVSGPGHALGALLLLLVRPMIDGPTPLHLIDAPGPGTGKGLLAHALTLVALGIQQPVTTLPTSESEIDKRVTAILMAGTPAILLDNVSSLKGNILAAALTSEIYSSRILGTNEMANGVNLATWFATGNNVVLDTDLARRTVSIRLDANTERPSERTGFVHTNLLSHVRAHRPALLAACLSLVQAWLDAGRPAGTAQLGSYEAWSATIGGILDVAGVPGFLSERELISADADIDTHDWTRLFEQMHERYQSQPQSAATWLDMMRSINCHGQLWERPHPDGSSRAVGKALTRQRDKIYGGYQLRVVYDRSTKVNGYALAPVSPLPVLKGKV
jgi:hypothetical protein